MRIQHLLMLATMASVIGACSAPLYDSIRASRTFAGPDDFPPKGFAGYGILAFDGKPEPQRGKMFCEAFMAKLQTTSEIEALGTPLNQQMVTVWPIDANEPAKYLREAPVDDCGVAVAEYADDIATEALHHARMASARGTGMGPLIERRGPYLLAWAPGSTKGQSDTLVLVSDLSDVSSPEQAKLEMQRWAIDIEANPALWASGWSIERTRILMQRWADRRASAVLTLIGAE